MSVFQYQQFVEPFQTGEAPFDPATLGWIPRYPDYLFRITVRAVDQPTFTTGVVPPILPIPETSWKAIYPDTIDRLRVRAADQSFFTTGSAQPNFPIPEASWLPGYPDRIWRTTLPTGAIPSQFLDPVPRVDIGILSAWAFYPDRLDRRTTHPALMPYHVPGPLEPIPNPPITGVLDDKIHLGTKESLGVTSQPTLGGWQAW